MFSQLVFKRSLGCSCVHHLVKCEMSLDLTAEEAVLESEKRSDNESDNESE